MSVPLWVPWVLVLSLAWPPLVLAAVVRRIPDARLSGRGLVALLVPALVMGVAATTMTLDRSRVGQAELDAAVDHAAAALDGSLGAIGPDRVATLVAAELGHDVGVTRSDLSAPDPMNASYSIEVRPEGDTDGPVACVEVALEMLDGNAPDLRFADVASRTGACA